MNVCIKLLSRIFKPLKNLIFFEITNYKYCFKTWNFFFQIFKKIGYVKEPC